MSCTGTPCAAYKYLHGFCPQPCVCPHRSEYTIMSRLKATTTVTTAPVLSPELQARVAALVSTYKELKDDLSLLEEQAADEAAKIKAIFDEHGIVKTEIDGVNISIVSGSTPVFDKLEFVRLGGSLDLIDRATTSKPKKAYLLVGKEKVAK